MLPPGEHHAHALTCEAPMQMERARQRGSACAFRQSDAAVSARTADRARDFRFAHFDNVVEHFAQDLHGLGRRHACAARPSAIVSPTGNSLISPVRQARARAGAAADCTPITRGMR